MVVHAQQAGSRHPAAMPTPGVSVPARISPLEGAPSPPADGTLGVGEGEKLPRESGGQGKRERGGAEKNGEWGMWTACLRIELPAAVSPNPKPQTGTQDICVSVTRPPRLASDDLKFTHVGSAPWSPNSLRPPADSPFGPPQNTMSRSPHTRAGRLRRNPPRHYYPWISVPGPRNRTSPCQTSARHFSHPASSHPLPH